MKSNKKIKIEEIKQQYPSLQKWSNNYALEIYKKIQEHQTLNEFSYTINPEKTIQQLEKQVGVRGIQIEITNNNNDIEIWFDILKKEYLEKINKLMDSFGWYPAFTYCEEEEEDDGGEGKYSSTINSLINKKYVTITYEAKYNKEVKIKDKYLYHLTPDIKWTKINVLGLTPKSQGKLANHPGRIYLFHKITNPHQIDKIAEQLFDTYQYKDRVEEMYLLKIDVSKLNNRVFFEDPNFFMGKAVWTEKNIPPYAIKIERRIKVI